MGKGKEREMQDEDFERERTWLLLKDVPTIQEFPVAGSPQDQAPGGAGTLLGESNVLPEDEDGLECGCCFSLAPFVYIITRPHSFEPIN